MSLALPMPPDELPVQQRLFFLYYLDSLNAIQSAIRAGYSPNTAHKHSYLWVGKDVAKCPKAYRPLNKAINEALEDRIEKVALTPQRVLEEWMAVAFFNLQDIFDPDTGNPLPPSDLPPETAAALESIQVIKETSKKSGTGDTKEEVNTAMIKFKAHSKVEALKFLSKYLRLDPTADYKQGGAQGGASEKDVIGRVLKKIDGKTRGLPAPVRQIPEHLNYNLEGE